MIKKALFLASALLMLVCGPLRAQQNPGRWTVYPHVASNFSNVIETSDKVYALVGGTLQRRNKTDNETYTYTTATLSEPGGISAMYYNPKGKYLLLTYESGNIDIIHDNGKVRNLPEIKNAVLTTAHTINNVAFHDGKIYVATAFGLVIYDDTRFEVKESCIMNINCNKVYVHRGNVVVGTNARIYYAPLEGSHAQFSKFTEQPKNATSTLMLGDDYLVSVIGTANDVYVEYISYEGGWTKSEKVLSGAKGIYPMVDGGVAVAMANKIYFIDTERNITSVDVPAGASGVFSTLGANSVWVNNGSGVTQYNLSSSTPTQLITVAVPNGLTGSLPERMTWSPDGERLYINHCVPGWYFVDSGDQTTYLPNSYFDMIENDVVYDMSILNASQYKSWPDWSMSNNRLTSMAHVREDPDDPSRLFLACAGPGVLIVRDRKVEHVFNKYNSGIPEKNADGGNRWLSRVGDLNIDEDGNLWVGVGYLNEGTTNRIPDYYILPAQKRKGDLSKTTASDWIEVPSFLDGDFIFTRGSYSYFCKNSKYKIFMPASPSAGFVVYDDNGTPLNFKDDRKAHHASYTDTEGNPVSPYYIQGLAEDSQGRIWVGTDAGLFWFNPADAFTADFRVKRPIVPRNDGTNYGDYLLGNESVYGVAVDASDRKWLATATSGVYLVSSDGTKILQNFTSANSELPSDIVECVTVEPNGNKVYFGTTNGLAVYDGDSAPASEDYSEVYAYPNPVRPDYTGWITVTGLMDNSLVKIADAAGNVFFQGRSQGGMISWDGCDPDGRRVRSGVYFVFASQNDTENSSGAVAKILVVN